MKNSQCDRDCSPKRQFSVLEDMVNRSARHLSTYFLAKGNEGNPEYCCGLVEGFRFFEVIRARLQHFLHVQNIPGIGECKAFNSKLGVFPHWVRDGVQS
mmetsp:Transcript_35823/g.66731  ORF Transcript_35823/g.66731 Transcript_35823/m.66731 type:complete len:99 (+) Transcript_35823:730-1026(+)